MAAIPTLPPARAATQCWAEGGGITRPRHNAPVGPGRGGGAGDHLPAVETRVTIDRLGHLGHGIAATPEGPLYVPGALPGEVVVGRHAGDRLEGLRILTPAPERVRPPCPHARTCGGCALQHAGDGFVARWKECVIAAALAAQGLAAPVRPILTSPPGTRRRATLAARRTKGGTLVGFHARASDTIVATPACHLLAPALIAALPAVAALTAEGASRSAVLAVTLTATDGGIDALVTGAEAPDAARAARLAAIAANAGFARLTWGDETLLHAAPPTVAFGPARVAPPPGAFLQATPEGEAALRGVVADATAGAARVADLFAGCGTFALPLAARTEVHAVEGEAAMLAALAHGARHVAGLHRVTTEARDLFRNPLRADELNRFDAVVLDPPRAGAEAQARALAASGVARVAMVSCNPVSFARDARLLAAGGLRLELVQPVDQFRWSPHIELAAVFTRGDTSSH